ncbi:MAG: FtsQ-type POTRA domain-containing protein [Clostridia bacterium]
MNKRIVGIFCGLLAVVVLVVLCCVIFVVGSVSVQTTAELELSAEMNAKILQDSNIVKYSSIFGISEEKAIENIEKNNPMLKVVLIERKFPNKVVINVATRVEMLAIAMENGKFAILDRELKILEIVDVLDSKKILSRVENFVIPQDAQVGTFVENASWLKKVILGAERISFLNQRFAVFFPKMEYQEKKIILHTNSGVKFAINSANSDDISTLISYAYSFFTEKAMDKNSGYIVLQDKGWTWLPKIS